MYVCMYVCMYVVWCDFSDLDFIAGIVRTMKARKTLTHTQLQAELMSQVCMYVFVCVIIMFVRIYLFPRVSTPLRV